MAAFAVHLPTRYDTIRLESQFLSAENNNRGLARHYFGSKSVDIHQLKAGVKEDHARANEEDGQDLAAYEEEDDDAHNYQPPNDTIKSRTMDWIERVVIGYNLCPFAERPLKENRLRISVVRGMMMNISPAPWYTN